MKILYCIPSLYNPGGMERVLTEKVNYLATLPDFDIYIVTTEQMGREIRFELNPSIKLIHLDIDFDEHYEVAILKKILLHKQKIKEYTTKLEKLIINLNIDICVSLCGKEIEFLSKLKVNVVKVAELHFAMNFKKQFILARKSGLIWSAIGDIRTCQFKKSVRELDKLIVLTNHDKMQWEKSFSNIIQIPNPSPYNNVEISTLDSKNVISVGKLDPQKGYDMLIDVWKQVYEKYPDWILNIFGQGEWSSLLEQKISDNHLQDVIKLRGVSKQIDEEYKKSSIYVMSSRYEGLPMVLIEAMSFGLPIVSFDCEYGPSEIISNDVDGYLVELNNVEELANRICLLIEDENKRKSMGKSAAVNVRRFEKVQIMQQWIDLFHSLMILKYGKLNGEK